VERRSILPALLPINPYSRIHQQQASTESKEFEKEMKDMKKIAEELEKLKSFLEKRNLPLSSDVEYQDLEGKCDKKRDRVAKMKEEQKARKTVSDKEKRRWPDFAKPKQTVAFERTFHFEAVPMEVVSKIIARLHSLIDGDTVYRDLVFLKIDETQAKITVEASLDRFVIEIRSPSLQDGEAMLANIKGPGHFPIEFTPHIWR